MLKESSRKGKIIVVAGIPGVGKTTVLNEALKLCQQRGVLCKVVNYGTVMLEEALRRNLVSHRDEMRKLPLDVQLDLQKTAAERIRSMAEEENVIVDTHVLIKTPSGYLPGLPLWVANALKPDIIALIEADVNEVVKRRMRDAEIRVREADSLEALQEHQQLNRSAALSVATLVGATVAIIVNREGKASEAAEQLFKLVTEG
ncbi:MAG: adenylate kinase [Candidatus Methanomethylicota archaeon]|uniref:Adenylate kinase n=1 Tax=Thermoproteota archaeon TaxID=2056631 RepID=A0A497EU53_9CREN|nr:MAG: adenylate kinase [Candidatus Verstraetearchaeota archaeon]RLE50777.1 MAG: adenylate kinase [Candidatus Verstraetearchaeota archaeon]